MEEFLEKHTVLPKKFIKDFFILTNKALRETDVVIKFDLVSDWLSTRKDHLKDILLDNFEEEFDYIITKLTKKDGAKSNNYVEIKISPQCFKEICMISQTKKAKEVRKYFLEMEKLVKRYYEVIDEYLNEQLELYKKNQKPKPKNKKGNVVYILEAMNVGTTLIKFAKKLYKIGKTKDMDDRIKKYNTGNANDVDYIFRVYVKDKDAVENCIKIALKDHRYRKYKEVYEVTEEIIKQIASKCADFFDGLKDLMSEDKKNTEEKIKRMVISKNKFFIIIPDDE